MTSAPSFGSLAWSQLWQVTACIVAVGLITRTLARRRPHLSHLLWLLVLAKCLTPPLIPSRAGIFSWGEAALAQRAGRPVAERDIAATTHTPTGHTADAGAVNPAETRNRRLGNTSWELELALREAGSPEEASGSSLPATAEQPAEAAPTRAASSQRIDALAYCRWIWAGGALAALTVLAGGGALLCGRIRGGLRDPAADVSERWECLRARLGASRRIALQISTRNHGPLCLGLRNPTVVLPAMLERAEWSLVEPVLAHELVHLRRRDILAGVLQTIVQGAWWFHPLVWWANRELGRVREQCCDAETIARLGLRPENYAQCLLDVIRRRPRQRASFAIPNLGSIELTRSRLERIMQHDEEHAARSSRYERVFALLLAAALLPGAASRIATNASEAGPAPGLSVQNSANPDNAQRLAPAAATDASRLIAALDVRPGDWPQWGGSGLRNNIAAARNIPTTWDTETGVNIKWTARLGTASYGGVVVANGRVYAGTNNGAGHLARYPSATDLGVLLCFDEATGELLWQHSTPKLPTGRRHDWPMLGICSAPFVEGERLWYVTNRGEVVCLDTLGFRDQENDGPFKTERQTAPGGRGNSESAGGNAAPWDEALEADVVWKFDMPTKLGVSPHHMSNCSVTCAGDVLFVGTSNGVDEAQLKVENPAAPSLIALDRKTGRLLWRDNSPGENVLRGQWSSPAYGILGGVPQVLFAGGDGWLYSFDPAGDGNGGSKLLWKFDCNPKEAKFERAKSSKRNNLIATPLIAEGRVYLGVGEDPTAAGDGPGNLWCVDPTKRGDVSPELVFNAAAPDTPLAPKRIQACERDKGDFTRPNPDSAVVWQYASFDLDGDGKRTFEETMHRTLSTAAIKDGLLFIADFSGVFHCVDAKTGIPCWTHDMLSAAWASPLIAEDRVYVGSEDGKVVIFDVAREKRLVGEIAMPAAVYTTPIVANDVLYIACRDRLFAIATAAPAASNTKQTSRAPLPTGTTQSAVLDRNSCDDQCVGRSVPLDAVPLAMRSPR